MPRDILIKKEKSEFEEKVLDIARVTRVTAGGKHFRFRATVVVGNRNGKIGIAVAKGNDVAQAVSKATAKAKKYIVEIPLNENRTLLFPVETKYNTARILLKPTSRGKGLVAGGSARTVLYLAGLNDISAKNLGRTSNKLNNAQATLSALKIMKDMVEVTNFRRNRIKQDKKMPSSRNLTAPLFYKKDGIK